MDVFNDDVCPCNGTGWYWLTSPENDLLAFRTPCEGHEEAAKRDVYYPLHQVEAMLDMQLANMSLVR